MQPNQNQPTQAPIQPAAAPAPIGTPNVAAAPPSQPQPAVAATQQQPASQPSAAPQAQAAPGAVTSEANKNSKQTANSTQKSLLLSELREDMIIMADGSFRAVIACQSINFDLMSTQEREGIEFSYQSFLNSLYFPIQIFVRSQRIDIDPYLDKLEAIRKNQDNMLLNVLMTDYINYIDLLSQEANIMDKSFFVIVPYFPAGDLAAVASQGKGLFDKLFGGAKPQTQTTKIDKATYEKAKDEIKTRTDSIMSGLMQVGVQSRQLNTKELGRLYYDIYNPDTSVRQTLVDFGELATTYVRRGANPEGAQNG